MATFGKRVPPQGAPESTPEISSQERREIARRIIAEHRSAAENEPPIDVNTISVPSQKNEARDTAIGFAMLALMGWGGCSFLFGGSDGDVAAVAEVSRPSIADAARQHRPSDDSPLQAQAKVAINASGYWCAGMVTIIPLEYKSTANRHLYRVSCDSGNKFAAYTTTVHHNGRVEIEESGFF